MNIISKSVVGGLQVAIPADVTPDDRTTLLHAATTYGFLVRRGEALSAQAFAQRICRVYGASAQRDAVVGMLDRCGGMHQVAHPDVEDDSDAATERVAT